MSEGITIDKLSEMAKKDLNAAICYELESDTCSLAKEIYSKFYKFYDNRNFSGDVIFTWKSPSLVKDGDYIGKREKEIENRRVIGNIFPNFITNRKNSLNYNRNGAFGDFPHDYFDIYLDHVAKYAYNIEVENIKEYYPLKRAIQYEENKKFFGSFGKFENFLTENYLEEIWNVSRETPFSDMDFEQYVEVSNRLMENRGRRMLKMAKTVKMIKMMIGNKELARITDGVFTNIIPCRHEFSPDFRAWYDDCFFEIENAQTFEERFEHVLNGNYFCFTKPSVKLVAEEADIVA